MKLVKGGVYCVKCLADLACQKGRSRGRHHPSSDAIEQGLSEFGLKRADAQTYGGRGQRQTIRGRGKAAHADAHFKNAEGFE